MTSPLFLIREGGLDAVESVRLDGPEGRHAARVRRITTGDRVDVTDGAGVLAECVTQAVGADYLVLDVLSTRRVPALQPRLVVVQALAKGDRGELAVEMMTEAGVDAITPWSATRCVVQWRGERGANRLARWRSTAREAAKQARRAWLPEITEPATTEDVAARLSAAALAIVLDEGAPLALAEIDPPTEGEIVAVVGPEGGITPDELVVYSEARALTCRLGDTVLRTSTAGIAALAVLSARTGRWSGKPRIKRTPS